MAKGTSQRAGALGVERVETTDGINAPFMSREKCFYHAIFFISQGLECTYQTLGYKILHDI